MENGPAILRISIEVTHVSPFFVKRLRGLSLPADFIRTFVETGVLRPIFYCSSAIFPGPLNHGFALLKRSIKLISQVCGLSFSYLTNFVCGGHIKESSDIAERIPGHWCKPWGRWVWPDHYHQYPECPSSRTLLVTVKLDDSKTTEYWNFQILNRPSVRNCTMWVVDSQYIPIYTNIYSNIFLWWLRTFSDSFLLRYMLVIHWTHECVHETMHKRTDEVRKVANIQV